MAASAVLLTGCGASLNSDAVVTGAANETTPVIPYNAGATSVNAAATSANAGAPRSAARAADTLTAAGTPGSNGYKIGPLDVLEFSVYKVPELARSVQVADIGTVNLPLVGEVQAVGRTAQELERDLATRLGDKYLQSPVVTIYIKEYNSQRVTIEGAVKKPGVYPVRGRTSLLQLLATAEGLDPNSDSMVVVFRQVGGKRTAAKFDIGEIRAGDAQDPVVQSGDIIVASTSLLKETWNNVLKALPVTNVFALM